VRVVLHVDRDEIDALFRKKLFRLEAAASPRLGEENELLHSGIHIDLLSYFEKLLGQRQTREVRSREASVRFDPATLERCHQLCACCTQ
jgi:hypothetical protein